MRNSSNPGPVTHNLQPATTTTPSRPRRAPLGALAKLWRRIARPAKFTAAVALSVAVVDALATIAQHTGLPLDAMTKAFLAVFGALLVALLAPKNHPASKS